MLTVERSHGACAAGFLGIGRTVEPQPEMIHLDWISWRIQACVRERSAKNNRRRSGPGCDNEGLYAETADKSGMAISMPVRFNIALVPGHSKRRLWDLNDEKVEISLRRQAGNSDMHDLDRAFGVDCHACAGLWKASARAGRYDHRELEDLR